MPSPVVSAEPLSVDVEFCAATEITTLEAEFRLVHVAYQFPSPCDTKLNGTSPLENEARTVPSVSSAPQLSATAALTRVG